MSLRLEQISKSYGARTLFRDVTYAVPEGAKVALVGANGAGKTTLLGILCGTLEPDHGKVILPSKLRLGYLPQKPNPDPRPTVQEEAEAGAKRIQELAEAMRAALRKLEAEPGDQAAHAYEEAEALFRAAGGYALPARAQSVLAGLGFKEADLGKHPTELSGGWRMRLELARLILSDPDVLVLDEPTNHLDLPSLAWFEAYLAAFRGTLLFVSHDRKLLNRLSTITLHLHGETLTPYAGNFDSFLEQREERLALIEARREDLRRRREHMEKFVQRFGAKASKAAQAQSRVKMIARLRDLERGLESQDAETAMALKLPDPPKTPRVILRIEDGAIGYERPLATGMNLLMETGAKVAVIGANGIGKSTFLKTLAGLLPAKGGRWIHDGISISYFAQDQRDQIDLGKTVLANLLALTDLTEKEARSLLGGFLFSRDDVFKPAKVLSGGELSRLGLAAAVAKKAGLLLLDEPTNHLDMASVETLASALSDSKTSLLFVSHDREFIDAVCTHVFAMLPDGRSMLFEGKLDDYARLAPLAGFPNVLDPAPTEKDAPRKDVTSSPRDDRDAKDLKRERQKLTSRLSRLEEEMAKARQDLDRLESDLGTIDPADYDAVAKAGRAIEAARQALEEKEAEWLELGARLEDVEGALKSLGRLS